MNDTTRADAERLLLRAAVDRFVEWRLAYGTFVSRKWQYLYMETPKCASTSTKLHLWEIERGSGQGPFDLKKLGALHGRNLDDGRLSLLQLPRDEALHFLTSPDVVRFYVFREPAVRLASAFHSKIDLTAGHAATHRAFLDARFSIAQKFNLPDESKITLSHFVKFVCGQPDADREAHWMSQRALTLFDLIEYNYVIDAANYAFGMNSLMQSIGVKNRLDLIIKYNSADRHYELLNEDANLIRRTYSGDYELERCPQSAKII